MRKRLYCLGFALWLCLGFFAVCVQGAPGDLDQTFGTGGKATLSEPSALGAAVQTDGKIVLVGDGYIARINADGSPDTTFGNAGSISSGDLFFDDVKIQSDGKIVAAGRYMYWFENTTNVIVRRLNPDGTADSSFNGTGFAQFNFFPARSNGKSIAIQSNGKIIVGGYIYPHFADFDFLALRLNTDGTLDTTFSDDGVFTSDFNLNNSNDLLNAVEVEPATGKILLAGYTSQGSQGNNFALMRLNPNGTLDTGFGSWGGRTTLVFSGLDDFAYDVVIQPDGKPIAAGSARIANSLGVVSTRFALARFNYNGSPDTTFGSGGKVTTTFGIYVGAMCQKHRASNAQSNRRGRLLSKCLSL